MKVTVSAYCLISKKRYEVAHVPYSWGLYGLERLINGPGTQL